MFAIGDEVEIVHEQPLLNRDVFTTDVNTDWYDVEYTVGCVGEVEEIYDDTNEVVVRVHFGDHKESITFHKSQIRVL